MTANDNGSQQINWPAWVINEMSARMYKTANPGCQPADWAKLGDEERGRYVALAFGALQWIVDQGWVRLPGAGE